MAAGQVYKKNSSAHTLLDPSLCSAMASTHSSKHSSSVEIALTSRGRQAQSCMQPFCLRRKQWQPHWCSWHAHAHEQHMHSQRLQPIQATGSDKSGCGHLNGYGCQNIAFSAAATGKAHTGTSLTNITACSAAIATHALQRCAGTAGEIVITATLVL